MTDSTFNAEQFLGTSLDKTLETRFTPVPVGEYPGQIKSVIARQFPGKKDPSRTFTALDVTWVVLDDKVKKMLEMDEPQVRQSLFLDLTPSSGLDFGKNKNVRLGRLREAVGQNRPGKAWSPNMLTGMMATIRVDHSQDENGDPMAEVTRVTKS